ncbi:MAG: dienelactone hydrolase family protein [Kiritimatiellae bacterium]|nr:dienelactone hydrolase family protein [Kiritimatiellia bacterium]
MTKLNYLLYVPKNAVSTKKKWPLMLFLHGAGERGNNLKQLKKHGPPKIVTRKELPFIIASPQCPKNDWWSDPQRIEGLNTLIDDLIKRYPIDKQRIYLTGLSMGGYGTWHLAAAYPDKFAAIAPICGGGNPKDAGKLANLPTWAFHGAKDNVVPLERSQEMVDALKKAGGDVTFTVCPIVNNISVNLLLVGFLGAFLPPKT